MRRLLIAHLLLVAAGFGEQSRYRMAALGGLVANATFGLLKVAILFATVEAAGGELAGYDVDMMSAYIWISQGMLGSVNLMGRVDIAERIRTGDVTVDFLRPLDVHTAMIAHELGRSLFSLLPRGLPSVLIGALVGMATPDSPGRSQPVRAFLVETEASSEIPPHRVCVTLIKPPSSRRNRLSRSAC